MRSSCAVGLVRAKDSVIGKQPCQRDKENYFGCNESDHHKHLENKSNSNIRLSYKERDPFNARTAGTAAETFLAATNSAQQEHFEKNYHSSVVTSSSALEQKGPFSACKADATANYLNTHVAVADMLLPGPTESAPSRATHCHHCASPIA